MSEFFQAIDKRLGRKVQGARQRKPVVVGVCTRETAMEGLRACTWGPGLSAVSIEAVD